MPDERLRIVVEALDKASAELKGLQKELEGVGAAGAVADRNIVSTTAALTKITGVAVGAAVALKKVYDVGAEGAAIAQTAESFERLGVSIEDLRTASRGTVDDMTLMSSTLTLVAGANAELQASMLDAAPRLLEIAKAANKLNPTLGDTAFMYESISTGIKRNSPLILDNLGIMVKVGAANTIYAEQLGKSVDQLTATERAQALLNATLEAGDILIQQVGGSIESQTDAYAQLETNIINITNALKIQTADAIGPIVARYSEFIDKSLEADRSLIGFGATIRMITSLITENDTIVQLASIAWSALTLQNQKAGVQITALIEDLRGLNSAEAASGSATTVLGNNFDGLSGKAKNAASNISILKGKIESLRSKEITITTHLKTVTSTESKGRVNKFQHGGTSSGGMALVGEQGPELVMLPAGSHVLDAQTTQSVINNNHYYNQTVNTAATSDTYGQDFYLLQAMAQ